MLRKSLSILFVVVLLVAFAPAASAQECPGEKVTLRLDDWSSGDRVQYMEQVLAAFKEANPCIDVVSEPAPGGGEEQHLRRLTMITAGTAPDLLAADSKMIPLYASAGGWMDLTPFLTGEDGLDPETTFFPSLWKLGMYEGKPVFIPKDYSTSAFWVNKALFEAAGLELPKEGWTYDDYLDLALQLTLDANGNNAASPDFDPEHIVQYGTDIINDGWFRGYQSFLYSWGAHTISPDGKTVEGYINSPEAVTAWEWYRDLVHVHHVAPYATEIGAYEGGRTSMFQNGIVAIGMTYHGPWWQDVLNQNPDFKWGVVPLPTGPGGHRSAIMMMGWGINAKTQHPQEAWKLLKWLTTEPGQRVFGLKALTAVQSVSAELYSADDPYWSVFINEVGYLDVLDEHLNRYYEACVYLSAGDLLTRLVSPDGDKLDVKAELDKLAADAQKCLDESAAK